MFIQGLIICLLSALVGGQDRAVLPRGHVFFATDFEGSDALKGWSGPSVLGEGFPCGHALVLERPAGNGPGYATATIALPVENVRGYVVQFSARIKAQNVSRKPQPWNGVKFMAPIVTDQETTWPAAELPAGSFDWQKVAFRNIIPDDAKQVTLVVGLEAAKAIRAIDPERAISAGISRPPRARGTWRSGFPRYCPSSAEQEKISLLCYCNATARLPPICHRFSAQEAQKDSRLVVVSPYAANARERT